MVSCTWFGVVYLAICLVLEATFFFLDKKPMIIYCFLQYLLFTLLFCTSMSTQ